MIGNNSCGVHSLMGLGTGRTSDQVHELDILLYDGTRMTVGATSEEELERIIRGGGPQGRDLRAAQGPPRPVCRRDPPPLSQGPPAPRLGLQPRRPAARERVPRRPGPVRHGGDVRHRPGGQPAPGPQPGRQVGAGAGLSRRLQCRRPRHGDHGVQADRAGGDGRRPGRGHEEEGHPPQGHHPAAQGGRLAAGRVRRRDQGRVRRQGPQVDGAPQGGRRTRPR